jgi:hypothetical protein
MVLFRLCKIAMIAQFIRDDLANWARQIKAAGIQPD